MRIDAHQHYWRIERGDYGWITPDINMLYRDFMPEDLASSLSKHELNGSIVVQAAPTLDETDFILELAEKTESILGVVGWLDLFDPAHQQHYDRFREYTKFLGFRIMIQEMSDSSCILDPRFITALQGYADRDVPIDLLVLSDQLEHTVQLLQQVPNLRGVIDHLAKPKVKEGEMDNWLRAMQEISCFPNMYCKLSGIVTEGNHSKWKPEDFKPYIHSVLELFGPNRVMFGSDWPVCLMAADYDEVIQLLQESIPTKWGDQERANLFGWNAKEFYKL
ncbi:amidohydrolase family protein [Paenibacillus sp. FSL H7-0714]|uniref:amidohydrolase family protein n=1 Tax=Paenibacillus sp. FSL H7-0714 TaxID=2954735 RepID=UPI0030F821A6